VVDEFQEKVFLLHKPYLKPTQVDGWNTLKPMREWCWRNSAKWFRNFGRRNNLARATLQGWHRIGGSDCL